MNSTQDFSSLGLFGEPWYTRWKFQISSARSEPLLPRRMVSRTLPPSHPIPSPPPLASASASAPQQAVEISPGVWEFDDEVEYSSRWPPVQKYLTQLRNARQMVSPPSNLVFALAALHVINNPHDPAHWLIWNMSKYTEVADAVDKVAFSFPRCIRVPMVWHGKDDHKPILNAIQEKFNYVYVQQRWYPIDYQSTEQKRTLRSSAEIVTETPVRTINQYFNFVEAGPSSTNNRRKKSTKKKPITSPAPVSRNAPGTTHSDPEVDATNPGVTPLPIRVEDSPSESIRASTRMRRKITPGSLKSPRVVSRPVEERSTTSLVSSPEPLLPAAQISSTTSPLLLPLSSTHSRSTSQDSVDTLINDAEIGAHGRSSSVTSIDTAVAATSPSKSKKRKADENNRGIENEDDFESNKDDEPSVSVSIEGMVTRGRASKRRSPTTDVDKSTPNTSRTCTPAVETHPTVKAAPSRSSNAKGRAKRVRV